MPSSSSVSSGLSLQSFSSSEPEWNSDHAPEGDLPLTDGEEDLKFLIDRELISESEDDLHPWAKPTSPDGKGKEVEEEDWRETEDEEEDDMAEGEGGFLVPMAGTEEGDEEG